MKALFKNTQLLYKSSFVQECARELCYASVQSVSDRGGVVIELGCWDTLPARDGALQYYGNQVGS